MKLILIGILLSFAQIVFSSETDSNRSELNVVTYELDHPIDVHYNEKGLTPISTTKLSWTTGSEGRSLVTFYKGELATSYVAISFKDSEENNNDRAKNTLLFLLVQNSVEALRTPHNGMNYKDLCIQLRVNGESVLLAGEFLDRVDIGAVPKNSSNCTLNF